MPRDTGEPQSYGSGSDWVTGKTGQQVNDQKSEPPPEHRDFYDSSREAETVPDQGGKVSDFQLADNAEPAAGSTEADASVPRVTSQPGGAKRDSFFKKRDYE